MVLRPCMLHVAKYESDKINFSNLLQSLYRHLIIATLTRKRSLKNSGLNISKYTDAFHCSTANAMIYYRDFIAKTFLKPKVNLSASKVYRKSRVGR
mmetsp:Transcript_33261/g.50168  ORF Transcript_33261/g.50168 Transcript_33261/m.50168 type:complete len:96 (-) Transcript_33261:1803-2090(-)